MLGKEFVKDYLNVNGVSTSALVESMLRRADETFVVDDRRMARRRQGDVQAEIRGILLDAHTDIFDRVRAGKMNVYKRIRWQEQTYMRCTT